MEFSWKFEKPLLWLLLSGYNVDRNALQSASKSLRFRDQNLHSITQSALLKPRGLTGPILKQSNLHKSSYACCWHALLERCDSSSSESPVGMSCR